MLTCFHTSKKFCYVSSDKSELISGKEVNEVKLFLNKQEAEFNDLRFFQLAELCAWLSYHAYEPKDESNSANPVTINEQVSLNFKYKEVLKLMDKHVFWFVAQDKARNIVYVVFRGTSVAGDVVIDLYADLHAVSTQLYVHIVITKIFAPISD